MPHYVGLDASKATTSICILDDAGNIVREGVVGTEPQAIIGFLRGNRLRYRRVGVEAVSFTPWLFEGLAKAALPVICIENRHAHGVLAGQLNKTDKNDARGIAQIMRSGHYKAVHMKTRQSQEAKLLLTARKHLASKKRDIESAIRGVLLRFGLKHSAGGSATFERRARDLAEANTVMKEVVESLLSVRTAIVAQINAFDLRIRLRANDDPVCRRLMTAPGVGPLTALAFRTAIDVPERFARSRDVGVHLGLTSRTYQSGATERRGRISKCGDESARTALFLAAKIAMGGRMAPSALKAWGRSVAERRGYLKAVIAVARKLAVILHRMWVTSTDFCREV
jgi:transposase